MSSSIACQMWGQSDLTEMRHAGLKSAKWNMSGWRQFVFLWRRLRLIKTSYRECAEGQQRRVCVVSCDLSC